MGLTDATIKTGDRSPAAPLARALVQPIVTIGDKQAEIIFAGLTPGLVGLYQINLRVPDEAPSGLLELVVT